MIIPGQITKAMEKYSGFCERQFERDRERNRKLWESIRLKKNQTVRFVRRREVGTKNDKKF